MAYIKYASGVERVSGRIGSQQTALSGCSSATTVRKTGTQAASNTVQQVQARELLRTVTQYWGRTMTQAQRDGWNAFAEGQVYVNRLCKEVPRTGLSIWTTYGTNQMITLGYLSPSPPVLPEPEPFDSINSYGDASGGYFLNNATNSYVDGAPYSVICKVSPGKPLQSQKPRVTEYRFIAGLSNLLVGGASLYPSASSQGLVAGANDYTWFPVGISTPSNSWIGIRLTIVNVEGRPSQPLTVQLQVG